MHHRIQPNRVRNRIFPIACLDIKFGQAETTKSISTTRTHCIHHGKCCTHAKFRTQKCVCTTVPLRHDISSVVAKSFRLKFITMDTTSENDFSESNDAHWVRSYGISSFEEVGGKLWTRQSFVVVTMIHKLHLVKCVFMMNDTFRHQCNVDQPMRSLLRLDR